MSRWARSWRAACLVAFSAVAPGCSSATVAQCAADTSVTEAARIWHARQLENYQFTWQQQCFCLPEAVQPIRITVRGGAIVSATTLTGEPVDDEVRSALLTIDALYQRVLAAAKDAARLQFSCDSAGVPTRVFIDPNTRVADDEFRVTISAFRECRKSPIGSCGSDFSRDSP
jgi:hypothetical protein